MVTYTELYNQFDGLVVAAAELKKVKECFDENRNIIPGKEAEAEKFFCEYAKIISAVIEPARLHIVKEIEEKLLETI